MVHLSVHLLIHFYTLCLLVIYAQLAQIIPFNFMCALYMRSHFNSQLILKLAGIAQLCNECDFLIGCAYVCNIIFYSTMNLEYRRCLYIPNVCTSVVCCLIDTIHALNTYAPPMLFVYRSHLLAHLATIICVVLQSCAEKTNITAYEYIICTAQTKFNHITYLWLPVNRLSVFQTQCNF